ncbi:hypothetical protein OA171_01310 [Flavobacteriales bacterium]|nr:hypothetical protein [Flavobacteriales bacterium]
MIETYKVRLEILKAKIENKPPLVIQKLHLSDYTNISGSDTLSYGLYPSASIIYNIDKKSNLIGAIFRTTARP